MTTILEGSQPSETSLLRIGRREHVDFPTWGVRRLRAKVDTGAYSSALGVVSWELIEQPSETLARFTLQVCSSKHSRMYSIEAPILGFTTVRSSTGCRQRRPVIETAVQLGSLVRPVRLTLTDRSHMRCRMLLGRQALAGWFLVDVQGKDLLQRR
ncbi:MAG: RimK/LysX family protein [Gemmataceae bacterium]